MACPITYGSHNNKKLIKMYCDISEHTHKKNSYWIIIKY